MMPKARRARARPSLPAVLLCAALAGTGLPCVAGDLGWDGRRDLDQRSLEFAASPYTLHYHYDEQHRPVHLLALNVLQSDGSFVGGAGFTNSFGQPSAYGYIGHKYVEPWGWERVYWSWTLGVIYGYHGEYKNKAGVNILGFTPAVVPRFGYQIAPRLAAEVAVLGTAGLTFSLVFTAPWDSR